MLNTKFVKNALQILNHWGFSDFSEIKPSKVKLEDINVDLLHPHEKKIVSTLKKQFKAQILSDEPSMVYYLSQTKNPTLEIYIIGTKTSVAEMILIMTVTNALEASGISNFKVRINSLGDQQSKERFEKELQIFFNKYKKMLPDYVKPLLQEKKYVKALHMLYKKNSAIVHSAPNPIDSLNDQSRTHLRNILEFLDYIGIEYELQPLLIGSTDLWEHTLFEIIVQNKKSEEITVARGGRYSSLTKKATKKEIEATGMIVNLTKLGKVSVPKNKQESPLFISYIGEVARIRALKLLDSLFKAGIPVSNAFVHNSIISQMKQVTGKNNKGEKIKYVILIGQKEALEDVVIVRNVQTNKEKIIPFDKAISYIKKLKLHNS